jgi:hypothetical protein
MIPRGLFDEVVAKHEGEKHAKGMTCLSQLVSLLFAHLGYARSLREITQGLAAAEGKLKHLGVDRAPTKSTLAYANEHRPWAIYKDLFLRMAALCQVEARDKKRRFKFKNPLVSLDSTVIPLCLSMYDWASYTRTKGAVKLHLLLDNATLLPQYAVLSNGKTADVTMAGGNDPGRRWQRQDCPRRDRAARQRSGCAGCHAPAANRGDLRRW